jgi:hypothetical protein
MKIESRIGTIKNSEENIYNYLSDFNNFEHLIPKDKVKSWESTEESCTFEVDGVGKIGLKIIDKEPYKTIKFSSLDSKFDFLFWIQLKQIEERDTKVKLTLKAELNPMFQMMAKNPLQKFINLLVEQIEKLEIKSV